MQAVRAVRRKRKSAGKAVAKPRLRATRQKRKFSLSEDAKAALDAVFAKSRKLGVPYVDLLNTFRKYDRKVDWARFDPETLDYSSKDAFYESLHRELSKLAKSDKSETAVEQAEQYAHYLAERGDVAGLLELAREVEKVDKKAAARIRALAATAKKEPKVEVREKKKPTRVYAKAVTASMLNYLYGGEGRPAKKRGRAVEASYTDAAAETLGQFWAQAEATIPKKGARGKRGARLARRRAAVAEAVLSLGPGTYLYKQLIAHVNKHLAAKGYKPTNAVGLIRVLETLKPYGVHYDKQRGTVYIIKRAGRTKRAKVPA